MKTIIAGSRNITDPIILDVALEKVSWPITEIVSGGARGVDELGEGWASATRRPYKVFLAEWDKFGKSAGYRRNVEMAKYADALIAIWDGKSKGTKHMIDIAKEKGLVVYVENIGE